MKICLLTLLSLSMIFGVTAQNNNMTDLEYFNKAVYTIKKKGDIPSGQIYMEQAFSKGIGNPTSLMVILISQEFDDAFKHKENPNYFYVPLAMCDGILRHCKPTENEKESIYAIRGLSKINIAISKGLSPDSNYMESFTDLEKGGEYGREVLQNIKKKDSKKQRKNTLQRKRLSKDSNFKID